MRSPTFLPHCALGLALAVVAWMLFPPPSFGGGYAVTACFGTENASWSEWEPSPFVTAYVACPGGVVDVARPQSGEGMMVRNAVGRGLAPRGAAAALAFDAPPGTSITGMDFDANMLSNPGWHAGIQDGTHGRWLWCGERCGSSVGRWIHTSLRGLATQRIQSMVRCAARRCARNARHGYIALRNVRVFLGDPSPPSIDGVRGTLVAAGGRWLRGAHAVAFNAADNSGIRLGRVEVDSRVVAQDARACDFTRRVPCSNGPTGATFDSRAWPDGEHVLRLSAQDAGGNWSAVGRTVRVDNTAPAEPAPVLEGGDAWNPSRARRLILPLPGGQAAPLARARIRACRLGGPCAESAPELGSSAFVPVSAFNGPAEYSVRVALEDAAGNVGPYAAPVTLRFDDRQPGAPDVSAADAWHNGGLLALGVEEDAPVSGIRGYRVRMRGSETVVATSVPLDDLADGVEPVQISAISGAGVESTAVRTTLKLDRSRPHAEVEGAPDGWSRAPVRLTLRGHDQRALSGVRSLAWTLDGGDEVMEEDDAAAVDVAADGHHELSYRAIDAAGNASEPRELAVDIDGTPPETVAFEAPDPADPRRVRVVVADRVSGVAHGRIELRRAGARWRPVKTTLGRDRLVALLDDASLRAGVYQLRARVSDAAGNVSVGSLRVDRTPAAVTLPLRRRTTLAVRRVGRLLRGTLLAGRRPLAGRRVTVSQRLRGRARWWRVCARRAIVIAAPDACSLRTDAAGRIELRLPRGPSRTLRLSFDGDAVLLPAAGTAVVRTRARARLHVRRRVVRAGGAVAFAGRLLGGHLPRNGKLVELQARVGAGWRTFATARTDRRGRFRHPYRFGRASGGRTYWFRLRVRREVSYPFEGTRSGVVAVQVV